MAKLFKVDLEIETDDEVTEIDLSDTLLSLIDGEETNETWSKMSLNASIVTCVSEMQDVEPRGGDIPMIKPTVGRVVLFTPAKSDPMATIDGQPCAAIIAGVFSDTCVNLAVFDANGANHSRTSVPLIQDDNPKPDGYYAEWMPYQKGQAAKTEELEKKLSEAKE